MKSEKKSPSASKQSDNSVVTKWRPSKKLIILIIISVAVLAFAVVLANKGQNNSTSSKPESTEQPEENSKQTETELRDFKHQVTVNISASGPSPQTLSISKDTRIAWVNKDKHSHKIAITPGTTIPYQFDNFHNILPGGGYPYVIHQPVTFHYYLVDKPKQGGTVIVK